MSLLINKARVREYTLSMIKTNRPALADKMTRVSESYYNDVDAALRNVINRHLETMSSSGKTIK